MIYPTSLPTGLEERKLVLTTLLADMEDYYQLYGADLRTYIITTSIVPYNLQIDLLIHSLDLYQVNVTNDELLASISSILADNQQLVANYQSGNTKILNSLVGKVIKQFPNFNPTQVKTILMDTL